MLVQGPHSGGSGLKAFHALAYGSVLSTYVLIVIGAVVRSTGSGGACPDWPTCNGQLIPQLTGKVLIEYTHRLFTLVVTAFMVLTTLIVWMRSRSNRGVLAFSSASFLALIVQIILGMVTVNSDLDPPVVTAHLAVATAVFGLVLVNAVLVRNLELEAVQLESRNGRRRVSSECHCYAV